MAAADQRCGLMGLLDWMKPRKGPKAPPTKPPQTSKPPKNKPLGGPPVKGR